jgi:hypothetical protein
LTAGLAGPARPGPSARAPRRSGAVGRGIRSGKDQLGNKKIVRQYGSPVWCLLGRVSVGSVWARGSSTTRLRVTAGGGPASTGRSLCARESVVAAGTGSAGDCATDAPSGAAPGPAAVLLPRTPASGSRCGLLDPVGPWATGVCADQPTSARHARRNARSQLGGDDIRGHPRDAQPHT